MMRWAKISAVPCRRVIDVHRVVIERGHRGHHGGNHRHGMGVMMETVEETQQRLVQHGVVADVVGELVELLAARQLTQQYQVRALGEGALLGELLDGVAAVHELPGITIDIGDTTLRRGSHPEAGIVGEHTQVFLNRRDIDDGRADRAIAHRQLRFALTRSIDELEFFVAHAVENFRSKGCRSYAGALAVTGREPKRVTWSVRRIKADERSRCGYRRVGVFSSRRTREK